jgi:hypothetical protein
VACRKLGIGEQTFYRWKRKFMGMGVAEVRRLEQLEEENRKLKSAEGGVADPSLDKLILQDAHKGTPGPSSEPLPRRPRGPRAPGIWVFYDKSRTTPAHDLSLSGLAGVSRFASFCRILPRLRFAVSR